MIAVSIAVGSVGAPSTPPAAASQNASDHSSKRMPDGKQWMTENLIDCRNDPHAFDDCQSTDNARAASAERAPIHLPKEPRAADPRNASRECNNRRWHDGRRCTSALAGMDHRPKLTND
jgi:hypothetical protein